MSQEIHFGSPDLWIGLPYSLISAAFFGSNFVLLRQCELRDGFFAQWMFASGVMLAGIAILVAEGFPPFYAASALGGMFWGAGVSVVIPVLNVLGMGPAYLLPDIVNCVGPFLIGYFGLMWTTPRPARMLWLALMGLVMILTGGILIAMVKKAQVPVPPTQPTMPTVAVKIKENSEQSGIHILELSPSQLRVKPAESTQPTANSPNSWTRSFKAIASKLRRPLAIALALLIGAMYAMCVTPTVAYRDTAEREGWDAPQSSFPYLFSFNCGAYLSSTLAFLLYTAVTGNRPYVASEVCAAGVLSGMISACGLVFWFLSLDKLGQGFTGPITAMMPGSVASLWSVFYFKEVKKGRSEYILLGSILLTLLGAMAIGLSK